MATLAMIQDYLEGYQFLQRLQDDAADLTSGDLTKIKEGWDDIKLAISGDPQFSNLFTSYYSQATTKLQQVTQDAESYLQSTILQVEQPDVYQGAPVGYMNLYEGSVDSNGNEHMDPNQPATVWDLLNNPSMTLVTDESITYYHNKDAGGYPISDGPGLNTDWSSAQNSGLQFFDYKDSYHDTYVCAEGSFAQWAPFTHVQGGDSSTLFHDIGLSTPV